MADYKPLEDRVGQHYTLVEAQKLDTSDELHHLRSEFIIPTKDDLKRKTLSNEGTSPILLRHETLTVQTGLASGYEEPCIYLCGNSLGLQPRQTTDLVATHLKAWAAKGVFGHFKAHDDSDMPPFVDIDEVAAQRMAPIVGASASEVAIMETLTANLHLMMASFYRPDKAKYKIVIEGKAFPSDHYAVESQIRHHGLDPKDAMILVEPADPLQATISTSHMLSIIDEHASSTTLVLLPGVQYYTGQYFDIPRITAHAHHHGIMIGWDLAHAVGNVELDLHGWDVDFAVWCSYKYLNSGPGAIAGLFVHEKHGQVDKAASGNGKVEFRHRLSGWWGGDKATRFRMGSRTSTCFMFTRDTGLVGVLAYHLLEFVPISGAAGFQVGNPCALAICPLLASLALFEQTSMSAIRSKSIRLTSYLEELLHHSKAHGLGERSTSLFQIITPSNPAERGAQLSIRLKAGMLQGVMAELEEQGAVVDERKPDVVRVAPTALYNTFSEVWQFVDIFSRACIKAQDGSAPPGGGSAALAGIDSKGWSHIK
ncbi:MAG: hypothetical protein Q9170_006621 [Blastenia crenularia]